MRARGLERIQPKCTCRIRACARSETLGTGSRKGLPKLMLERRETQGIGLLYCCNVTAVSLEATADVVLHTGTIQYRP